MTAVLGDDLLATVAIDARHVSLKGVHLHDITDYFDFLVEESCMHGGHLGGRAFTGNLFECSNRADGGRLLMVRMAPTPEASFTRQHNADFQWVNRRGVAIYGTGIEQDADLTEGVSSYSFLLLPVADGPTDAVWRAHYRQRMQRTVFSEPLSLSNTWGDRNQDAALNESFAMSELEALEATGIRGLMLDDGWQAGVTANSKLVQGGIWEGYHATGSNFWTVHPEKFPQGLEPVCAAARAVGKELALWFSPDSSDDFANWEKDAAILLDLYRLHGIRAFKLDGIKLRTRRGEARFGRFLDALASGSDGRIFPVLDVTSEIRQGYFREMDHGILFLENRYTDWGNYFPYRTLRNVWQLSRWIPAQRLHIEFLNPRRNPDKYAGDPFAPERYSIDYLYAMTLVGHPLAWMEVQHLDPDDRRELKKVADWHADNHQRLMSADIVPIGDLPDGRSWSGFRFDFPDGSQGVLVFRDNSQEDTFIIESTADLVRHIGCADAAFRRLDPGHVELRLPQPHSWVYASPE
jgi:alpha-galactosidase